MAQTGYTPILIYSSSTAAAAPAAGGLTNSTLGSELAINITDGKLFYKDNANAIQVIGWKNVPISTLAGAGTGVLTALGVNVGTAGSFVVNGGALGTPSSGTVTNLTGTASININGTVGATTPNTGAFTTLSATGVTTVQAGTVSAPAITTSGDTNTGIFFPAADTVAIGTNGTESFRVTSAQNVRKIYGTEIQSLTSGGSTSHMLSYQTWNGTANLLVLGNTFDSVVFATGGGTMTEKARLHTSGGFSLGNTTDPGAGALSVTDNFIASTSGKGLRSTAVTQLANNGTKDFSNFSGFILVNNWNTGGLQMWIVAGGGVTSVSTVSGGASGTMTYVAGINGYRFTNTSGNTQDFGFGVIQTRDAA